MSASHLCRVPRRQTARTSDNRTSSTLRPVSPVVPFYVSPMRIRCNPVDLVHGARTQCCIKYFISKSWTWTRLCSWPYPLWSWDTFGLVSGRRADRRCSSWRPLRTGCCWSPRIRTTSACSSARLFKSCRKWKTCVSIWCVYPSVTNDNNYPQRLVVFSGGDSHSVRRYFLQETLKAKDHCAKTSCIRAARY